ncbi:hypothetical protein APA_3390 [Pseudanabaena sp. lw0831]|nr:hypothetical protein APA_3390 [Pseudanabaena sp. lw0831]
MQKMRSPITSSILQSSFLDVFCIDNVNTFWLKYKTMDAYFVLNSINFVWEEEKARIDPVNHEN